MKNEKIILTDIEKEKLLACVELVAKDFETKRYEAEKELNEIEKAGGRDGRLVDLMDFYRERRRFYIALGRKIERAIDNKQI